MPRFGAESGLGNKGGSAAPRAAATALLWSWPGRDAALLHGGGGYHHHPCPPAASGGFAPHSLRFRVDASDPSIGAFPSAAQRLGTGMYPVSSASHRPLSGGEFSELGRGSGWMPKKWQTLHPFLPLSEVDDLDFYFSKKTNVGTPLPPP